MKRRGIVWLLLLLALALAAVGSMLMGPRDFSRPELQDAVLRLRAYRTLAGALAGAGLGMAGVLVQGLFRNPLASPSILGTSSGAGLGGMLALFLGQYLVAQELVSPDLLELGVPLGCCLGAGASLVLLLVGLGLSPSTLGLLLGGVILSSLFASIGSLLTSLSFSTPHLGRALVTFSMGGLGSVGLGHVCLAAPMVLVGGLMAWRWARPLDLLLTGEQEAQSLGLEVGNLRRWVVIWVAVLTASAVAVGGNLTFVGLVVPHMLRPFVGVRHRGLLVGSALGGASFVVLADLVTRATPPGIELPLGVVTSLVGAPLFLTILVRSQRKEEGR